MTAYAFPRWWRTAVSAFVCQHMTSIGSKGLEEGVCGSEIDEGSVLMGSVRAESEIEVVAGVRNSIEFCV